MKNLKSAFVIICMQLLLLGSLNAQTDMETSGDPFIDMMIGQVAFAGGRISSLAEAIPEDAYSWRPAEGVRSTGEVIAHVVSAAYGIPGLMGVETPEHITRDLEKTLTDRAEILENLKSSIDFASGFLKSYDTANFEEIVKTPFGEFSQRMMILILNNHFHEHLGQLIAYARSNDVTPPWSMEMEEEEEEKEKKITDNTKI